MLSKVGITLAFATLTLAVRLKSHGCACLSTSTVGGGLEGIDDVVLVGFFFDPTLTENGHDPLNTPYQASNSAENVYTNWNDGDMYGLGGCAAHDSTKHNDCIGLTIETAPESFCFKNWCFVSIEECDNGEVIDAWDYDGRIGKSYSDCP